MKHEALKAAVLISGTGSNLKALIDAVEAGDLNLNIVRVVSNREDAPGNNHATTAGIPISVISHKAYPDRQSHEAVVAGALQEDQAELIILAGYMRILSETFTRQFNGRMINLHPSLLPLYKGLDTYNRALQSGDRETGASIHFVTAGLDSGPVISQVRIAIMPDDDATSISQKLGPLEHQLLVATVALFCDRRIQYLNQSISYQGQVLLQPLQLSPGGRFTQPQPGDGSPP